AVSGFLIVGVIIGPEVLNFLTDDIIHRLSFFDPLALSIITFIIGQGLNLKRIKDIWLNIISISFFEITVTVFLTYLTVFLITNSEVLALLMAIISISTAPATLVAVTEQMRAKGKLTDILSASVALNNMICITLFSLALPFVLNIANSQGGYASIAIISSKNILTAFAIGLIISFIMAFLTARVETSSELLIITLSHILVAVALAYMLETSPLLTTLFAGIITANIPLAENLNQRIFQSLREIAEPIYLIFFVLSGAALRFNLLYTSGLILVGYVFARSLGKTVGPFLGGMISGLKFDRGKYLSMGFLSQSAIAIGLSLVARDQYPEIGEKITAVVLGAVIIFEIVGPYLLKNLYQLSEEANQKKDDKLLVVPAEEVSLTKIMVPIGTKPPSVRKVKIITGLAKKMNGQLLALNVRRFPAKEKYIPLNSAAEKALKIFKELVEKEEIQVEILIEVTEDVPDTICKTAVNEHIDLIIMGVSGRTGFLGRFGGGGVTQKVSGRIGCPVLIIPD
ncbi:MAG: cation:proton antiporter, partial [Actinomycetia bacterium]|nr:cation:proton antiporter [Actinomycetes bacterium]